MGGGTTREPEVRPAFQQIASFDWRAGDASRDEVVVTRLPAIGRVPGRRTKFRDDAPMSLTCCFPNGDV
jgi:hypothetical protein